MGPLLAAPALGWLATRHGWTSVFVTSAGLALAAVGALAVSLRANAPAARMDQASDLVPAAAMPAAAAAAATSGPPRAARR